MADDGKTDVPSEVRDESEARVICTKCDEQVEVSETMSAGRVRRICKLCYNENRALAEHFKVEDVSRNGMLCLQPRRNVS